MDREDRDMNNARRFMVGRFRDEIDGAQKLPLIPTRS